MSGGRTPATSERAEFIESGRGLPSRRRRRRGLLATVVVVVVLVGAGAYVGRTDPYGISFSHPLGLHQHHAAAGAQVNDAGTSLATVERRSLSETTSVNGTLGYAGSYTVLGQAQGTVTWLPTPGQVIRNGHVLYRVDGKPVVLLYGSAPAYRTLAEGATASDVSGKDVAQLNHNLVALGYADKSDVDSSWDELNWATKAGVERLQDHLRVDQTGELALGDVVFLPTAARVTTLQASLGGPATGPVLHATSTKRTVSVALAADLQSEVKKGDRVTITLPDNSTASGVVSSVGTVATVPSGSEGNGQGGSDTGPTVPVHIRLTHPHATGSWDQAPVVVAITERTVHNVLTVPVSALLARSGGGYAVEVVDGDGTHHLVRVRPGLSDNTQLLVQVTGSGLAAGQRVVVAGQ